MSLQAIITHRSSAKYKSLVRSLQTYVNINHIVHLVLHIENLLTNNPNNDTEDTYDTGNITDTNSTNYDSNNTLPIHLDTLHLSDYIDNIQTNILHNNNIHIKTINDTQPCQMINSNISNSSCYDLSTGLRSQNNIYLTNKINILQYILDLHHRKYKLPSLQLNIKNFNFDNIQNLIDLDYEQLINSYIV